MKKLVALFLAACMTFSLAACGSGSSENTPAGTKAAYYSIITPSSSGIWKQDL